MSQSNQLRILVTGDRAEVLPSYPTELPDGIKLEWKSLQVLCYDRIAVSPDIVERLVHKPAEWVIFTSPRAVEFWVTALLDSGWDFPAETRVACIGEKTADVAAEFGLNADFVPSRPGTEGFLDEFEPLLRKKHVKPTVFIPMAEGGRLTITNRLKDLGCEVLRVPVYRTRPVEDLSDRMTQSEFDAFSLVLFTSPSSVDALTQCFSIGPNTNLVAIGDFTARHLQDQGYGMRKVLPEGDFARIAEVL
jgi:uroporphyrinogen-III synthase